VSRDSKGGMFKDPQTPSENGEGVKGSVRFRLRALIADHERNGVAYRYVLRTGVVHVCCTKLPVLYWCTCKLVWNR
jgi:hypothetical protein